MISSKVKVLLALLMLAFGAKVEGQTTATEANIAIKKATSEGLDAKDKIDAVDTARFLRATNATALYGDYLLLKDGINWLDQFLIESAFSVLKEELKTATKERNQANNWFTKGKKWESDAIVAFLALNYPKASSDAGRARIGYLGVELIGTGMSHEALDRASQLHEYIRSMIYPVNEM